MSHTSQLVINFKIMMYEIPEKWIKCGHDCTKKDKCRIETVPWVNTKQHKSVLSINGYSRFIIKKVFSLKLKHPSIK